MGRGSCGMSCVVFIELIRLLWKEIYICCIKIIIAYMLQLLHMLPILKRKDALFEGVQRVESIFAVNVVVMVV